MLTGSLSLLSVITAVLFACGFAFAIAAIYTVILVVLDAVGKQEESIRPLRTFPAITAVIAAKNEAGVLPATLRRLIGMEYPVDRLRIIVAVDEGDTETAEACIPYADRVKVVVTHSRSGKPGVLNEVLPKVETELMLLLDADSLLDRDALVQMVPSITEDGFIATSAQGYPLNEKEGIFPRFFRLECRIQAALNNSRKRPGSFAYTPGFGTLIVTEEVRKVSGWDTSCLSEDSDLALRLFAGGARMTGSKAMVGMEAPAQFRVFFRQRLRWYRGMLDSYRKRRGLLAGVGPGPAVEITVQFLSPLFVAFFLPFCAGALFLQGSVLILLAGIVCIMVAGALVVRGDFSTAERILNGIMLIPFLLLNSAICIIVVATFILNMRLQWSRTEKSHFHV
jgi:cellulose synthase/poly-beta-1,6-N-acetylglucosamine synthase-like glycosyltransferase